MANLLKANLQYYKKFKSYAYPKTDKMLSTPLDGRNATENDDSTQVTKMLAEQKTEVDIKANSVTDVGTISPGEAISDNARFCWICLLSENDCDPNAYQWLQPCACRGSTKWVHSDCLHRWVDEKQKGAYNRPVKCYQCQVEYLIVFGKLNLLARIMQFIYERFILHMCPYIAIGILACVSYIAASIFGAVSFIQIAGPIMIANFVDEGYSVFIVIILPSITVGLLALELITWEDRAVKLLLYLNDMLECGFEPKPLFAEPKSWVLTVCSAMSLPTIATMMGCYVFTFIENLTLAKLVGGLFYVLLKGFFMIYLTYQSIKAQRNRRILNYIPANIQY